jgi:hypothetical protein
MALNVRGRQIRPTHCLALRPGARERRGLERGVVTVGGSPRARAPIDIRKTASRRAGGHWPQTGAAAAAELR